MSTAHERHRRWLHKAGILTAALPYMQLYAGSLLVIKLGGNALEEAEKDSLDKAVHDVAHDIVLLKQVGIHPVLVHGGGPQIDRFAEKLGLKQQRLDGLRITDRETRDCAAMTLSMLGKKIVRLLQRAGGEALALCGQDAQIMRVQKLPPQRKSVDLGFVGKPDRVEVGLLRLLIDAGYIPVLAPVAADEKGELYNVNADAFAGALAVGLGARRLLLMTDVAGVKDEEGNLVQELDEKRIKELVAKGIIHSGMLPKIETCTEASRKGVSAVILDGRVPHTLLLELFTETGTGSLIRAVKKEQ